MDVVKLNPTTYLPSGVVEGYESMIFTERFQEYGDFELSSYKIPETRALLPEGTLISHLDTHDVHMVEDHDIEVDEIGRPILKVTGTSLDMFVDHRHVEGKYGKKRTMARKYTISSALAVLLWNAFDNNTGKDVTREGNWDWPTLDRIANIAITESAADDGESRNRWLKEGPLGPQIKELLTKGDMGIRMIRPHDGLSKTVITVAHTPLEDRGTVTRTVTNNITQMCFDIFDGIDRTATVKFRTLHGDLDKVNYLHSIKKYKTVVEIMSGIGGADQYRTGSEALTGLDRRVTSLDAGEPDVPPEPEKPAELRKNASRAEREQRANQMDNWLDDHAAWKNKKNEIEAEFREDYRKDADRLLKDTRRVSMLSGDISPLAPYEFKTHYNLGDKVTLLGDDGLAQTMVVTEYIRSEDNENGDKGFPGLTMP